MSGKSLEASCWTIFSCCLKGSSSCLTILLIRCVKRSTLFASNFRGCYVLCLWFVCHAVITQKRQPPSCLISDSHRLFSFISVIWACFGFVDPYLSVSVLLSAVEMYVRLWWRKPGSEMRFHILVLSLHMCMQKHYMSFKYCNEWGVDRFSSTLHWVAQEISLMQ